MENELNTVLLC